jgi:uncharacterized protein (TIGR03118 family)
MARHSLIARKLSVATAVFAMAPLLQADPAYVVQNLVSNQPGVAAFQDPNLVNAWGLASSPSSPFWVGDNGRGKATLYNSLGAPVPLVVAIPGDGSVTGVTFTGSGGFNGDLFLFASEDGTVSGWRGALGTTAEVLQLGDPSNIFKGITYGTTGGFSYSYLANFNTGSIDVLKGDALAPNLAGSFTDPGLPSGYSPFNIQNLDGTLYVTYAVKNGSDELDAPGLGIVSRFDLNGNFLGRLVNNGGDLNAPWGLAIAPTGFGFDGALLIGSFGDGTIHAYNSVTGAPLGALTDTLGTPIVIDGLWALRAGNGGTGGLADHVYFTSGPDKESNGLFGALAPIGTQAPIPEPSTCILVGSLLLPVAWRRLRHRDIR